MNSARKITSSAKSQLSLLEAMRLNLQPQTPSKELGLKITQLVSVAGLLDADEVQRYLYILEGQRMVRPVPEGDLTSDVWTITDVGLETLKKYKTHLEAA